MVNEVAHNFDEKTAELYQQLWSLHRALRTHTKEKYNRINPFYEDLFSWQERGHCWTENDTVTIYNSTTVVGDVVIGDHTWIGPFCALDGTGGLTIGRHCAISQGCQLLSHDTVKWALSGGKKAYDYAATSIGDNCFLGAYAVILKGVGIGRHCVVAAGAVVTKDIADCSIVAGVPAKIIGKVVITDDDIIYEYD